MNRKSNILSATLALMVAGVCFQSCQQDDLDGSTIPDRETLIKQGRYLTARSDASLTALQDPDRSKWFESGTPYRLLAFSKPYDSVNAGVETNTTNYPRFNKVAWEGKTAELLHFINVNGEPDKLFGFSALDGETGGDDGLVSLDFYGFTYGKEADPLSDYIPITGQPNETITEDAKIAELKHAENVTNGELKDLMWGSLLNQNIKTAGLNATDATQSIMPFTHCFSHLRFMTVQESDASGAPYFGEIRITSVKVTGTYESGNVYLQDGLVELPEGENAKVARELRFDDTFNGNVTTQQIKMGEMMIYPSDGASLKNMTDGYNIGLEITVWGRDKATIEKFLANTNPAGSTNKATGNDTDGWTGTVVKKSITDYYHATPTPLRFKRNTIYYLVLSFQKEAVRIITVIPQIEEWLPGEGTAEDPWQDLALGQPQMFDNIVWSDRNIGADHYDPRGEFFEDIIGYFYQSGRNIPYYPFDSKKYYDLTNSRFTSHPNPTTEDKHNSVLADVEDYNNTRYRFYPMVDPRLLRMKHQMSGWGTQSGSTGNDRTWIMESNDKPQMFIPETMPVDAYFDFMRSSGGSSGLGAGGHDMKWDEGQQNQPVSGSWVIPTSKDFMTIFPSTPHAGNITFRAGGSNDSPTFGWGGHPNNISSQYTTLRVTVPCYYEGMAEPTDRTENYRKAWNTLKSHNDVGTTRLEAYSNGRPDSSVNLNEEPDGDPEDGYASTYVISREESQSVDGLDAELINDNRFYVKTWGTIYAIKRVYTSQAYRMRWKVMSAGVFGTKHNPGLYVEICRYRCEPTDSITEENYLTEYDWDHPAARIYFPICGLGDWTGNYINFGTECQYATSDPIVNGKTTALHIKITGSDAYNTFMAVITKNTINQDFAKQIRPIIKKH